MWWLHVLAAAATASHLPDFVVDPHVLAHSLGRDYVPADADQCAIEEGCSTKALYPGEPRTLLRFSTRIWNFGTADVRLRIPDDPDSLTPDSMWEFAKCHGHYHLRGYANHTLLFASNHSRVPGIHGVKAGFCMRDNVCRGGQAKPRYTCDHQGLSVDCADHYGSELPCQWVDATKLHHDVAYVLRVEVNVLGSVAELNYTNNAAEVQFVLSHVPRYRAPHVVPMSVAALVILLLLLCCAAWCASRMM